MTDLSGSASGGTTSTGLQYPNAQGSQGVVGAKKVKKTGIEFPSAEDGGDNGYMSSDNAFNNHTKLYHPGNNFSQSPSKKHNF